MISDSVLLQARSLDIIDHSIVINGVESWYGLSLLLLEHTLQRDNSICARRREIIHNEVHVSKNNARHGGVCLRQVHYLPVNKPINKRQLTREIYGSD